MVSTADAGSAADEQSKRVKHGEDGDGNGSFQLGDFPDVILHRILSLLPLKDAATMSLSSKRWRDLWLSIPVLAFHEMDFRERSTFMTFVERTLLLRDPFSFEEFSLSCNVFPEAIGINSWIASVVRRGVKELRLRLRNTQEGFVLPYCLFGSKSMTKLRLNMHGDLILPSSVCLSNLKDLTLELVRFVDSGSVQNLFLSCPALESLSIHLCHWMDRSDATISAPNLRALSIRDSCDNHNPEACCSCKVVIDGPKVSFFSYHSRVMYRYRLVGSSSLNKVTHSFQSPAYLSDWDGFSHLMNGISKVKSLTLSALLFQADHSVDRFEELPIFCNMTELKLDTQPVYLGLKQFATLLRKCPRLTILEITQGFFTSYNRDLSQELEPAPPCFESQLKKIVVRCFDPHRTNCDSLRVLLKKATVLEEMVLYYDGSIKDNYKVTDLLELPRGSRKCKISLIL